MAANRYDNCIRACLDCFKSCETCIGAHAGEQAMAECIRLCIDCSNICEASAGACARDSRQAEKFAALCAEICDACGAECAKFDSPECHDCAEKCRHCAEECRSVAQGTIEQRVAKPA